MAEKKAIPKKKVVSKKPETEPKATARNTEIETDLDLKAPMKEWFNPREDEYDMDDFGKGTTVDRYHLELEASKLAHTHGEYAKLLNESKTIRDRLKARLNLIKAAIFVKYKVNPPKNLASTDTSIKAAVEIAPEIIDTQAQLLDAERDVYTLEGAIDVIGNKRSQIKNLTELWKGGYYSSPTSGSGPEVADNIRSKMSQENDDFEDDDPDE